MAGSSPLSRGIPRPSAAPAPHTGIIPALAGNTVRRTNTLNPSTDHPRSRGEYSTTTSRRRPASGSSPLSRGIPLPYATTRGGSRIIPALAGNTGLRGPQGWGCWDHPRSRGEYVAPANPIQLVPGSSPLSRGILNGPRGRCWGFWIIPALAGNTGGTGTP